MAGTAMVAALGAALTPLPLRAATPAPARARAEGPPAACIGPRPLPGQPGAPAMLYVADVSHLSNDEQLMFAVLQGIVNRSSPQIYLEGMVSDTTAAQWLATGAVPLPAATVQPYDLLSTFRSSVAGLVVWDPNLAVDSQDVATTIAGQEDLLPVSPALAAALTRGPYHFTVRRDLRTRNWKTRAQAYEWALSGYGWPRSRVVAWLGGDRHGLRDLLVACRAFVFQADPETDGPVVGQILARFPAQTPVFGYPCLDDPVSSDSGVPVCEPAGVGEISQSGKFLIPTDLAVNLSVHTAFPPVAQTPSWDNRAETPDPTKTYVTFVISDGDNVGYNEEFLRGTRWSESAHGAIPIGVSVSPWLGVYAPRLYAYYVATMKPGYDALVAGPSGGGYVYPGSDPALDAYLEQTRRLFAFDGLSAPWILDNGYASSPSPAVVDRYVAALHPPGVFADYFGWMTPNPPAVSSDRGVPVVHAVWGSCPTNTLDRIKLAAATYPGRPAFVFVALNTWSMGFSAAQQVMSALGGAYVAVRPDTFLALLRGAGPLGVGSPPAVPPAPPALVQPTCAP